MDEEELREKLAKLEKYEAKERRKKKWKPYVELEAQIAHMYSCQSKLDDTCWHQDEADEISDEFGLGLVTWGSASVYDALEELNRLIEIKEKEAEELYESLTGEEE